MFTLFDYLDPTRTEERRQAQRDDAARDRARKQNLRQSLSRAVATPFLDERRELLASLSEMWTMKDESTRGLNVLDDCPRGVPTPGLPRSPRRFPVPGLRDRIAGIPATVVYLVLLMAALLGGIAWQP
jgi:hypothetical protein